MRHHPARIRGSLCFRRFRKGSPPLPPARRSARSRAAAARRSLGKRHDSQIRLRPGLRGTWITILIIELQAWLTSTREQEKSPWRTLQVLCKFKETAQKSNAGHTGAPIVCCVSVANRKADTMPW